MLRIGRLIINATGWPWQLRPQQWASESKLGDKWGWRVPDGMGRFGGGWRFKLGITIGRHTAIIDLLYGSIRIQLEPKK